MFAHLPKKARIVEVGPRDGLQNESKTLSTSVKAEYIRRLCQAGLKNIETTSFVRAEKIPQMGDAKELMANLQDVRSQAVLTCLVPNLQGLTNAVASGVQDIAVFTATSESFNKKNINATIAESLTRIQEVMEKAQTHKIRVRAYVSTVFGCPYEGATSIDTLKKILEKLISFGAYEVSLGDTIGVATPGQVQRVLRALAPDFDKSKLAMHFHDTRGMALANILTSLLEGMTVFDSSSGGLGGCPYAKGATGNVATEDVVYLLHSLGVETGIDPEKLFEASRFILQHLGKDTTSKYLLSLFNARGIKTGSGSCA